MHSMAHCRLVFRELGILTFFDLQVMESDIFFKQYLGLCAESHNLHYHDTSFKDKRKPPYQNIKCSRYDIVRIYNKLPLEIRNETEINLLKKHLKTLRKNSNLYSIEEIL